MSNPDFPGSWRDPSGYPDERQPYADGYSDDSGYYNDVYQTGDFRDDGYQNGNGRAPGYESAGWDGGGNGYNDNGYNGAYAEDHYYRDRRGRPEPDGDDYAGGGGRGYPGSDRYGNYAGEPVTGYPGEPFEDFAQVGPAGYGDDEGYGRARTLARRGERADSRRPTGLRRSGGRGGRGPGSGSRQRWPWQLGWWRHWTWRKAGLLAGGLSAAMALVLIAGFFTVYSLVQVPVSALNTVFTQSSMVYFNDGKSEVGCFCGSTGTTNVLTEAEVQQSTNLVAAVLAAEDRNYFNEGGISITGLLRAAKNIITGGGIQGASTITEQFVKRAYYGIYNGNLTYKQKLEEILVAIKVAKVKDKWWILTHYLNDVYLGGGANGAGDAAEIYFHVPAWKLTAPQAAMIAAMLQEPGGYDPYQPHAVYAPVGTSLYGRWQYVINGMVTTASDPHINVSFTQQDASAAQFPKVYPPAATVNSWSGYNGYIMQAVANELENWYGYQSITQIEGAGLRIVTTFSKAKMDALYSAVSQMKAMITSYGGSWPNWARLGAVLENPTTGGIEAMYSGPNYGMSPSQCAIYDCNLDMALGAREQVGSSFKPYVLATAVSQGMNVGTSKLNGSSPLCVPPDFTAAERQLLSTVKTGACPPQWAIVTPDNATRPGPVSVAGATAASSNPAYVDLAHFVGTQNVINMAQAMGVNTGNYPNGSNLQSLVDQTGIALGIASLSVGEQASTFATLANNGQRIPAHVITKITDTQTGAVLPPYYQSHTTQPLTAAQAADTDWALSFDTSSASGYTGTGTNAALSPPRPMIAKTGTTDSYHSAFFCGALPGQYSFVVGMFTKDNSESLSTLPTVGGWAGGYGGAWPATLWRIYMSQILSMDNAPVAQLPGLQLNGFQTWMRANAPAAKPTKCQPGGKAGKGGHGQKPCPGQPPAPTPTPPVPTGTPTPTPTPTSPSPSASSPAPGPSRSG